MPSLWPTYDDVPHPKGPHHQHIAAHLLAELYDNCDKPLQPRRSPKPITQQVVDAIEFYLCFRLDPHFIAKLIGVTWLIPLEVCGRMAFATFEPADLWSDHEAAICREMSARGIKASTVGEAIGRSANAVRMWRDREATRLRKAKRA